LSLLTRIKSFFAKEAQTVDSIVADIVQKVEHLGIVAEANKLEQKAHDEVIAARQELQRLARLEEARARAIAYKLKALVS